MKRSVFAVISFCLIFSFAMGQTNPSYSLPSYNSFFNNNFLRLDRLSVKQSFSMSYLSSSKGSLVSNLYRNSMNYKISDKLELNLELAYRFTPNQFNSLNTVQSGAYNKQGVFLPSFGLRYQPAGNLLIEFQYNQSDIYQYGTYPWDRRF